MTSWSKVSLIDAGRFDPATAYAAVNRIRLDDQRPHVYRTHDYGKTWREIVRGLPDNAPVNAVREDPVRRGLLFAGTERAVFVSFDDGDDWQALRLNMPATSIRDLVVHGDDVVVGTHGRSFWILDDITPLRQLGPQVAQAEALLFKPQVAYRVRRNVNTDTPLPPEEPTAQNPPDGAILNYYLKSAAAGPMTLEVFDAKGSLVRRFASTDPPEPVKAKQLDIPTYWIRPPRALPTGAGMQRFVWDLHYAPPPGARRSYPIAAIYGDTPSEPLGPAVLPGTYTVKLTAQGRSFSQPLVVKMDPRVPTAPDALAQQFALALRCYEGVGKVQATLKQVRTLRAKVREARERVEQKRGAAPVAASLTELDKKASALEGQALGGRRGFASADGAKGAPSLTRVNGQLLQLLQLVEGADAAPTPQAVAAALQTHKALDALLERWSELRERDLKAVNDQLRRAELPVIN
jgi:hypothetical protein